MSSLGDRINCVVYGPAGTLRRCKAKKARIRADKINATKDGVPLPVEHDLWVEFEDGKVLVIKLDEGAAASVAFTLAHECEP